jgi:chromosome segregation protein
MSQAQSEVRDIVGHRVLIGVQVVDISRLSTHPIPAVHGGLITVAGQGPSDSNGAGKSSWIAAISLLHADEQWRLASGAADAAGLLFTAEAAGQEGTFASIDRGYVIGVFSDPHARTVDEIEQSAITVWLRINRKAPYLDLRWTGGLHIPYGVDESDRASLADPLWDQLSRSNGRQDYHANRLQDVLFGDRPRCMSFLSTSVRAAKAANLLAEPLNELGPVRIFEAIAALTGLQVELEGERAYRKEEYEKQSRAKQVKEEFEQWEEEVDRELAGIDRRNRARELLETAGHDLRSWHARRLIDGTSDDESLIAQIAAQARIISEADTAIADSSRQLDQISDSKALDEALTSAKQHLEQVSVQDHQLEVEAAKAEAAIETAAADLRTAQRQAEAADGRDVDTAVGEHETAVAQLNHWIGEKSGADRDVSAARQALERAEQGRDVATSALQLLEHHGIGAAALIDIVEVPEPHRHVWEPRLTPYLEAVVVATEDSQAAERHLAGGKHPTTILVHAQRPAGQNTQGPACVDERFDLTRFFAALEQRATDELIDHAAGISALGDYSSAITGRAARIAKAQLDLDSRLATQETVHDAHTEAKTALDVASERVSGAMAVVRASELQEQIQQLRQRVDGLRQSRDNLVTALQSARTNHDELRLQALSIEQSRAAFQREIEARQKVRHSAEEQRDRLDDRQTRLNLPAREKAWGGTADTANQHILEQSEDRQAWTEDQWAQAAVKAVEEALSEAFLRGEPRPSEIEALYAGDDGWKNNIDVSARVARAPAIVRAVTSHLSMLAAVDSQSHRSINQLRQEKKTDLDNAERATEEARIAAAVVRNTTIQAINRTLKTVRDEFDRLDRAYGGYGADLEWTQPTEPATPDARWEWAVTPRWRRTEGGSYSPFNVKGNTAQMDEKAVKLVCAAALAAGTGRPLLLILDELGRNLGSQHRREAVALFERIGRDCDITVIGALQDDMERYAIASSKLYIKLRRRSDAMPYNEAPVVIGDEANRARVELLKDWLDSYRGARPTLESA